MKKILFFSLICLVFLTHTMSVEAYFNDIHGHWAESTIEKWQDCGYINGYPDGSFKPNNRVTRAELAKILASAFDLQKKNDITYEDVSEQDWYYSYLEKSSRYIPIYSLPVRYESNEIYTHYLYENIFLPEANTIRMHVAEALVKIKIEKEHITADDLVGGLAIEDSALTDINDDTPIKNETLRFINEEVQRNFYDSDYEELFGLHRDFPKNVKRMNKYTWLANKLNIMVGDNGYFHPYGYMTRAELLVAIDKVLSPKE